MKKLNENVKGILCLPVTETAEKKIGDVGQLEATTINNGVVLMKSKMTAMEVIQTVEDLRDMMEGLILNITNEVGICKQCENCEEVKAAVNIKIPNFILEEAGIPSNSKLCAYTNEDSGEVTVVEAEYKHDLSDVTENTIQLFKEIGICMSGLNDCLMTEKIVYGN